MKRLLGNIYCYYYPATVEVTSACGHGSKSFSVGVMIIIIDNEPIIESNNLFSYGIKVIRLWPAKI